MINSKTRVTKRRQMELNFQPFKSSRITPSKEKIGIRSSGSFYFYSSLYRKKKLHEFRFVQLNYDKTNKAIGFLFTNNEDLVGVLKLSHRGNSASVRSMPFWRETEIKAEDYQGDYSPQLITTSDGKDLHYILLSEGKNENKT